MLSQQQRIFAEQLYRAEAVASYYAEKYHGRKTANGEIFNMNAMTCAHKTLPFNTVLRVTNLANGKNVQVRVNDRGPFVNGREIDLSKGAAIKLDMMTSGTARVKIEIVKEGNGARVSSNSSGTGKKKSAKINNADDVLKTWDKLKSEEKTERKSAMDGLSRSQAALISAQKIETAVNKK